MKLKLLTIAAVAASALLSISAPADAQTQTVTPLSDAEFERLYAVIDTDKDGRISNSEFARYQALAFGSWDVGLGGFLTREQIRTKQFERELRKSDGNPQGDSLVPGSVQKR